MDEGTIALTVMSGLLLISFLGFLVWGIRSGQFKNIEEAKYRIFDDSKEGGTPDDLAGKDRKGGEGK